MIGSLIGSLAVMMSHGKLGSPAPDRLIADTLNRYAAPSKTSFTVYFVSERKSKRECDISHGVDVHISSQTEAQSHCHPKIPVIGPFWFTRLQ